MELGGIQRLPGVRGQLHAKGFGRHTFLCGQSGSGKTYTLGIILERLLLDTDITIVVADPNSDYVNLQTLRPQSETGLDDDQYHSLVERFGAVAQRIHVFGGETSPNRLQVRFGRLTTERRLGLRIENLGVDHLSIWAGDDQPIAETLPPDARMAILDLGSVASQRESSIAAGAMLGRLWENRHERQPTIIVIDEAHNICPRNPAGPNQALATDHLIRIAGEGRKFGLYLLLATQRPEKVHQSVLSQCDNLLLMKMNSAADIRSLCETFSYAPAALVEQSAGFRLGEGLAAGKIAPDPLLFRSGRRYTLEGGSDVPSTWASRG
ncbi:MAG: ATP-binding protein [Actinomycetia bacterium]|nr:ATP-binding protein [Actinomycetes bacterium]